MYKSTLFLIFIFFSVSLRAQMYDKVWVTGWDGGAPYNPTEGHWFNNFSIEVQNDDSPAIWLLPTLNKSFNRFSITMNDISGSNLLFYTNGVTFWNKDNQKMKNGDSLAFGWFYTDYFPPYLTLGTPAPRHGVCLLTDSNHIFYYFYTNTDFHSERVTLMYDKLFVAKIDTKLNQLTFKDSVIVQDRDQKQFIASVKAANNKGWWIVSAIGMVRCFYITHLDSINKITSQKVCNDSFVAYPYTSVVCAQFTNDGKKMIVFTGDYGVANIEVMDFNRCTGELTPNYKSDLPILADSGWITWGAASSPNSRFIYAFCSSVVLQFDLWAADIAESMKVVAYYSGIPAPDFPFDFMQGQLALDGKIYITSGSTVTAYAVIHNPDEEGLACNVEQDIPLPAYTAGFPYYPNYRLGVTDCDNNVDTPRRCDVTTKAYPIPATEKMWVEYDGVCWDKEVQLDIYDVLGRRLYRKQLPMYSALHSVDVKQWSRGMYVYSLVVDCKEIGSGKFIKY